MINQRYGRHAPPGATFCCQIRVINAMMQMQYAVQYYSKASVDQAIHANVSVYIIMHQSCISVLRQRTHTLYIFACAYIYIYIWYMCASVLHYDVSWSFVREINRLSSQKDTVMRSFGASLLLSWTAWTHSVELSVIWDTMTLMWCDCNSIRQVDKDCEQGPVSI